MPVRLVPEARTAAASFLLVSRSWASGGGCRRGTRRRAAASPGNRARWGDALEDAGGLARGQSPSSDRRDQVAQHRVQQAGGLVAGPRQVPVPLSPDLQHRGVVLGEHRALGLRAQRCDRHREGIVGVVLVRVPRTAAAAPGRPASAARPAPAPRPRPAAEPAMPQPGGALHRPGPLRPRRCPRPQLLAWDWQASTRSSPSGSSPAPIATAVWRLLCGSIPIITSAISTLPTVVRTRTPRRACLITVLTLAPLRATPRHGPAGWAPRYKARPPA